MLQFLCLQMCMYGGGVVPQGGVGDRHLVTIPQGVVGDRLPWGGERQGGGGVRSLRYTQTQLSVPKTRAGVFGKGRELPFWDVILLHKVCLWV